MDKPEIISLKAVTHRYKINLKHGKKELKALDSITAQIPKGVITGYVGLNGAGKTTTIKILAGILRNTSGEVIVNNSSPFTNRIAFTKQMGIMFGQINQLLGTLTLADNFELIRRIYDINKKDYNERIEYFLNLLHLTDKKMTPARYLSFGQSVKANLIISVLHNPVLLLLDEPTIGVDVVSKDNINAFLRQINADFKTSILITSHDIYNIEKLVTHILLIDKGKLLFNGAVDVFKTTYKTRNKITVEFNTEDVTGKIQNEIAACFTGMQVSELCFNGNVCSFFIPSQVNALDFVSKINAIATLKNILVTEQNLEETIKRAVMEESNQ